MLQDGLPAAGLGEASLGEAGPGEAGSGEADLGKASPAPTGDPLDDRIRLGLEGSFVDRLAIARKLAKILADWHAREVYHAELDASFVLLDAMNTVNLTGPETKEKSARGANIAAFGVILYSLLRNEVYTANRGSIPNLEELYQAGYSPGVVEILEKCFRDNGRYSGFREILRDLEEVDHASRETHRTPWNPQLVVIVVLGVLAALAVLSAVLLP